MNQKMLVIDDELVVLESCKKIFKDEGFDVVVTSNPQEGLDLLANTHFDVILCDWQMPDFDGMDVVEQVHHLSPESAVVMISGHPTVGRATEAMKKGAMDYVAKPFTPDEISLAVKKAVSSKLTEEKKVMGRFEKMIKQFPVASMDDKTPQTIAEAVAQTIGTKKITTHWAAIFVLGILAGAYIAFGALLSTVVTFDMVPKFGMGFTSLIRGSMFSVGLMLVVIAGGELFTGNNLMVSSALDKGITWGKMLNSWTLVFFANFIGSIIMVLIFYYSGIWKTGTSPDIIGAAAVNIAYKKISLDFWEALVRGIGCNWLVCLAVWMALSSRQTIGKIFAIFFPIMAFVAIGFEHCIANMYFIPVGIILNQWAGITTPLVHNPALLNWGSFIVNNLIPVTIGNIIGGGLFVGMSYWSAYLRPLNKA